MTVFENFNLSSYNSYKLNAVCKRAFFPNCEDEVISIFFEETQTKRIILGNGNNVILSKEYFDDDFIIFNGCFDKVEVNGNEISAQAGASMLQLSEIALVHSLTGLEIFYDIPSSVGGAVVMNAGTKDGEIKDLLLKVRYLDLSDLQIKEINRNEIGFEYRNSFFQKHTDKLVLNAWFELSFGIQTEIKKTMELNKVTRWDKQPREYPNCGSVFKRPSGYFVGKMIDELGLKGFTIGGAKISEKHSGFIINNNNAKGEDILAIISEVQKQVREKFGVLLEVEQRII